VGVFEGSIDGGAVGVSTGDFVGFSEGDGLGLEVGPFVRDLVGSDDGLSNGVSVGTGVYFCRSLATQAQSNAVGYSRSRSWRFPSISIFTESRQLSSLLHAA